MGCQHSDGAVEGKTIKYQFSCFLFVQTHSNNPQQSLPALEKANPQSKINQSITYYQTFLQNHPNLNYPFDALGNQEDQVGYYEGRVAEQYRNGRLRGDIHGNPYDALSLCFMLKHNVNEGLEWYKKMIALHSQKYQLYFGIGNIYYKLKQYNKAQEAYRKCIDLNPRMDKAYQVIANIYCYKHFDNGLALQWSKFALKINPKNQYAALIKALSEQDTQKRINNLIKLRQLFPKYARICNALGAAFYQMGHIDEAIDWYLKGYEIDPNYYAVCCSLGMAFNSKGDNDSAIKWSHRSMSINSQHHECYSSLGEAHNRKGNKTEAEEWYKKCVEVNPSIEVAHFELGCLLKDKSQTELSVKSFQKCLQINPQNTLCLLELAKIYANHKNMQKTIQYLETILELDPNNKECLLLAINLFTKQRSKQFQQKYNELYGRQVVLKTITISDKTCVQERKLTDDMELKINKQSKV